MSVRKPSLRARHDAVRIPGRAARGADAHGPLKEARAGDPAAEAEIVLEPIQVKSDARTFVPARRAGGPPRRLSERGRGDEANRGGGEQPQGAVHWRSPDLAVRAS